MKYFGLTARAPRIHIAMEQTCAGHRPNTGNDKDKLDRANKDSKELYRRERDKISQT